MIIDLRKARVLYVVVLGFMFGEETSDASDVCRYEERLHHSLVLRRRAIPAVDHVAFRVAVPDDLEAMTHFYGGMEFLMRWVRKCEVGQSRASGVGPARVS